MRKKHRTRYGSIHHAEVLASHFKFALTNVTARLDANLNVIGTDSANLMWNMMHNTEATVSAEVIMTFFLSFNRLYI